MPIIEQWVDCPEIQSDCQYRYLGLNPEVLDKLSSLARQFCNAGKTALDAHYDNQCGFVANTFCSLIHNSRLLANIKASGRLRLENFLASSGYSHWSYHYVAHLEFEFSKGERLFCVIDIKNRLTKMGVVTEVYATDSRMLMYPLVNHAFKSKKIFLERPGSVDPRCDFEEMAEFDRVVSEAELEQILLNPASIGLAYSRLIKLNDLSKPPSIIWSSISPFLKQSDQKL